MHHEHHPGCGHEYPDEQIHHMAEHMGRMCCAGHCQHPEHQHMQALMEQQYFAAEPITLKPAQKTEKKRKAKKAFAPLLGQLIAKAARCAA